ncbi:MAG: DoxX family protein [Bacteroidales bacterium]|nr:DoxX family protein [Bacteroidales bacterium]
MQENELERYEKNNEPNYMPTILTVLRILVGWHFLHEGISKLATPDWSSSSYLMESKWLFSGFFHWIVAHPKALMIADILNIWGLICIGLGLFLGIFTRIASIAGTFLLLLYYVSSLIKNYFTNEKVIETLWLYET